MRIGRPERAVAKFRHTTDSETPRGPREIRPTLLSTRYELTATTTTLTFGHFFGTIPCPLVVKRSSRSALASRLNIRVVGGHFLDFDI